MLSYAVIRLAFAISCVLNQESKTTWGFSTPMPSAVIATTQDMHVQNFSPSILFNCSMSSK